MNKVALLLLTFLIFVSCSTPKAAFMVSGDQKAPATLSFENQSTNADSYWWDFAGLGSSKEASPNFKFPKAGNYLVTLKAMKGKKTAVYYDRIEVTGPEKCLVLIETEMGNMLVELYNETPIHQANFMKLAEEGYYNDLLFHRVIKDFMIQGGDPKSKGAKKGVSLGSGGPGYTIPAEFVDTLVHIKGALAAARTSDQVNPERRSSGSQFYIVQGRPVSDNELKSTETKLGIIYPPHQKEIYKKEGGTPFLDQNYTVFGRVIEGMDVIDKIAKVRTNRGNRPNEDVKMKISVLDYYPDKINP